MARKISFHDLEPGDIVSAYGTTLEVRRNSLQTLAPGIVRTTIVWQDLEPEHHHTYSEPWEAGLRIDLEDTELVINR